MNIKRVSAVVVMLVCLPLLTASSCKDEVTAKSESCSSSTKCTVTYTAYVDGKAKRTRTVAVKPEVWEACEVGSKWPDCSEGIHKGMRNIPLDDGAPVNDPLRDRKREQQDKNAKTVCVHVVSFPKAKITNTWFIGNISKHEKAQPVGTFERCRLAQAGQIAGIKSEHHAEPSTILCSVWVWKKGKKDVLDFMITQALGDCEAKALIPE